MIHCRCKSCGKRRTTRKHPDGYRVRVACPVKTCGERNPTKSDRCYGCGADLYLGPRCRSCSGRLRFDQWANRRPWRTRLKSCTCGNYHYPHTPGYGLCHMPRDGSPPEMVLMPQMVFDPRLD